MSEELHTEVAKLRHQFSALTLLLESLYVFQFGRSPEGPAQFAAFANNLRAQADKLTVPWLDPASSDDAAQSFAHALDDLLKRIQQRLQAP